MQKTQEDTVPVVIIGAGIGGITAAISLQRKIGFKNYKIYEKANDLGGTWRQNTYPGCSSDIPVHLFSLSTDPNPDWDHVFGSHSDIKAYWKHLTTQHGIESHIDYNREVISAVWDEDASNYTLNTKNTQTGAVTQVKAKIVISAIGLFQHPKWPEIPGRESFKGISLHAQAWDHSVEMNGKRVGLIGNGCAGSQILPCISQDKSTVITNFCKTPSWYVGRRQTKIPQWPKWMFRNVPVTLKVFRYMLACYVLDIFEIGCRSMQSITSKALLLKNTMPIFFLIIPWVVSVRLQILATSRHYTGLT
ncbi:4-hydroxyacetophenone monooxygenase OS=Pseudomonas fluorescens GN=hapE PE=1 SV=1 [Rhizoctonia solani AG-1 IB]|uniref:4-hydroxyacetophenone monooxygenase n=1 Tax=Thanatephorus cucumeris (strain AG1-IB / isolate 7/3/14) TaxID=1108050 RepID=A0A0B7FWA0_THACB|nr:4-hydroxyacetophenone monooxygenase OS=Pseudomonas fluorescens GN=hapE PE=1 SV=1 [Rhizoctonia solani AG-1 IB]